MQNWKIKNKNWLKAVTLIELLIVVIIIAIVSVAGLAYLPTIASSRLDSETRKIVTDIGWARLRAVATHLHHAVNFEPVEERYSIYKSPTGTTGDFIPDNLLKQVTVEVSLSLIQSNLWIYSPKGNTYGTDSITLDYGGKTKQIRIFPDTGYVKVD